MIERKFVKQNLGEFGIKEFIRKNLSRAGLSDVKLMRTPLGEKIIVYASRPGLVVGRGGANISQITQELKKEFNLENPQLEIEEVPSPDLDPNIVAELISNTLERFGPSRFKGIGYKSLQDIMGAGARGVEILISGKIPSARAKTWRFYAGYLKKCGDTALTGVDSAYSLAKLKTGAVGIKVSIMPPSTKLPDDIEVFDPVAPEPQDANMEEVKDKKIEEEIKEKVKGISENTEETEPSENGAKAKSRSKNTAESSEGKSGSATDEKSLPKASEKETAEKDPEKAGSKKKTAKKKAPEKQKKAKAEDKK